MKVNYKPMFIFVPICLTFLLLILTSEILFMVLNNSPELNYLLLSKAKYYAQVGKTNESLKYLNWLAKINIYYNHKEQKAGLIPISYNPSINKALENTKFVDRYLNILKDIDISAITKSPDSRASEIFYELGLAANSSGLSEVTINLLQAAIYIEPQLSFYHVELANYYLMLGNKTLANKTINYCFEYKDPYKHCKDYLDGDLLRSKTNNVGFMKETINNYYLSKIER
jgi:tetratricopeptide (TPR) repeat protein